VGAGKRVRLGSAGRALDEGVGRDVELPLVDPGRRLAPRQGIEVAQAVVDEDRGLGPELVLREAGGGFGGGFDRGALGEQLRRAEEEGGRALAVAQEPSRECTRETREPVTKATRK
jgi:hypothetical protein